MATAWIDGTPGTRDLTPAELQDTRGGCELFCAIARGAGYLYERSLDAAAALWDELTDDGPSLYYQAKAA